MFQLVVEASFLETLQGQHEPWTRQGVLGAHYSGRRRALCSGRLLLNWWNQSMKEEIMQREKDAVCPDSHIKTAEVDKF